MNKIEWNKVTWYSKLIAVILFVATFAIAFDLGIMWESVHVEDAVTAAPGPVSGGAGAHCGGFIKDAPTCSAGFHCVLTVTHPDTGGTCVAD